MLRFGNQIRPHSHALLIISMGQPNQTGSTFSEMASLVNNSSKIRQKSLLLADSLQRLRFLCVEPNLSEEEARAKSQTEAEQWLMLNKQAIISLVGDLKHVKRWDEFLLSPRTVPIRYEIDHMYANDIQFKRHTNSLADIFCRKYKEQLPTLNRKKAYPLMVEYVLEECAVMVALSQEGEEYDYELYLGRRNRAMAYIHSKLVFNNRMLAISILPAEKEKKSISFEKGLLSLAKQASISTDASAELSPEVETFIAKNKRSLLDLSRKIQQWAEDINGEEQGRSDVVTADCS